MTYIIYVSQSKGIFFSPLLEDVELITFCECIITAHGEASGHYKVYSLWVPDFNESKMPVVTEII